MKHWLAGPLLLLWSTAAFAHPLAPSLWVLSEGGDATWDVTWKTPVRGGGPSLAPQLPDGCRSLGSASRALEGAGVAFHSRVECPAGLWGHTLSVEGLAGSASSVLLRIEPRGGAPRSWMLTAATPSRTISREGDAGATALRFFGLGTRHLLGGADHVLFVVLVTWLVGWGRRLVWSLSAFTLGHSVTLALAVLGYVHFPTQLVESLIALSIVVAAAELARPDARGLFRRAPMLAAGAFGTLHGMGFAGALAETGLPAAEIPLALLSFNVGIELGQLTVVVCALLAWRMTRPVAGHDFWIRGLGRALPGYALGTLAAVWFWQQSGLAG